MTNYEKYRDDIIKSCLFGNECGFKVKVILKAETCGDLQCNECKKYVEDWFDKEYKEYQESKIDWSNVPIDTPILVWETGLTKIKRYFAGYSEGKIYAWTNGKTSWSANTPTDCTVWKYAELANIEKNKHD